MDLKRLICSMGVAVIDLGKYKEILVFYFGVKFAMLFMLSHEMAAL
jgi:hypothetical protein